MIASGFRRFEFQESVFKKVTWAFFEGLLDSRLDIMKFLIEDFFATGTF